MSGKSDERNGAAGARELLYLAAAYALTLPVLFIPEALIAPSADLIALLRIACAGAFVWHAAALLRGKGGARWSAAALALATGLAWTALLVIYAYREITLLQFVFAMVLLALEDAGRTLEHVLGDYGVVIAVGGFVALVLAASAAAWVLARALRTLSTRLSPGRLGGIVCLGLVCYLAGRDVWYAASELVFAPPAYLQGGTPLAAAPLVPDYSALPVRSRESVFIVQLESVNTHAVFDLATDGSHYQARVRQPGLETILKEGNGVLFPLFWANATQTHRAWESMLCGVSGNLGLPLAYDAVRLLRTTCLPNHLGRAGYSTVFLYSYFNLDFFDLRGFAKMAGFQEVAYGPKLMAEGDRRHQWAYDDCVFYERAFQYLARHQLDKREAVFAHFEVGMNHSPFINSRKYPEAHPFPEPANSLEHYVNSVAEQDHCLLAFWKAFRRLDRDDVHLFILPDHGIYGMFHQPDAMFATWLAYIPPRRRAAEFTARAVLAPIPSQAQIYPTVLELLGGEAHPASFAFALRGERASPRYDDCHLLTEPFSKSMVVRRNGERMVFRLRYGDVVSANGQTQPADARSFAERFACR